MTLRGWWIFPELIAVCCTIVCGTVIWHGIVLGGEFRSSLIKGYPSDVAIRHALDITYGTHYAGPYVDEFYPSKPSYGKP